MSENGEKDKKSKLNSVDDTSDLFADNPNVEGSGDEVQPDKQVTPPSEVVEGPVSPKTRDTKEAVNKTNPIYLAPVTLENLSQYMGTGIIGLTSVKDPEPDPQTISWPANFIIQNGISKSALTDFGEEICYLKLKDETVTPAKGRSQLKRPLSVVDVEAVLFESEEEVTRFRNSYGQFADVPLEFFTLKAFSSPFSSRSDIQQDLELKRGEGDQTDLLNKGIATANLFVGLRNVLGETDLFDELFIDGVQLSVGNRHEVFESLIREAQKRINGKELSDLDQSVLKSLSSLLMSGPLQKQRNPSAFLNLLEQNYPAESNESALAEFQHALNRLKEVIAGNAELKELGDKSGSIILRAVYLAAICSDLDQIKEFSNRLKAGVAVTGVALLIGGIRFGYLKDQFWRSSKTNYQQFHEATKCIFQLDTVEIVKKGITFNDDLSSISEFSVNDTIQISRKTPGDPVLKGLMQELRKLHFEPKIIRKTETTGLEILVLSSDFKQKKDFSITFWNEQHQLTKKPIIVVEAIVPSARINKAFSNENLASQVANLALIGCILDADGNAIFRSYLLDKTMDLDELDDKIQVLSAVWKFITSE